MPRLLGRDTNTGSGGGSLQAPAGIRSPLLPLRSISSPALSLRTTLTSAQPHQLVTPVMRAAEQLQQARQQQQQRSPLPLELPVIAEQPSDWARLQQERSEQRSQQRAASQRLSEAVPPFGSGSGPLLDDAEDQEPPPSADDKIDEGAIPPFQPPSQQPSPDPPVSNTADTLTDQQQQLTSSSQQHEQQLQDDAREEMNEAKYADAPEPAGSSAMQIDSAEPAAAQVTSFSSLFSSCGSVSQSSQASVALPSLSQLDMDGSQQLDDGLSQWQSQAQSQALSQTLDSTPPLGQPSQGGSGSMHLTSFMSDNSSSKLAFHAAPPAGSHIASQPTRSIAAMVSDINQKNFRKQQHKQGGKPLLAVNKSAPRYTPPAPQFDGTQPQSTPPLQQQPPKRHPHQQQQSRQPLAQQLPLQQQQQQQQRPVQPVQPPQQQPVRSQSSISSSDAFFSFSQPTLSSHHAPTGESGSAAAAPPKNLAHRSLPPQQTAAPAKRRPACSRIETKTQMLEEYRAMFPGLVDNWACISTMKIAELRVIMVGQGEPYSKVTRTELLAKLLPLAQAGRLKPPAAAVPPSGSNGAKQKPAAAAAGAGVGAGAGRASSERFSMTQIPEEDDSPEEKATSLSQGSSKRHKTTHDNTSAQQWQHLADQRSNVNALTSTEAAQQGSLSATDLDLAARSTVQPPWASAPLVVHGEHFSRPNCALSPFILQAGVEVVVSVHEYLRFRCAHQCAIDKLAQFKSDTVNPRGHRPTLVQLGGSSGLVRARVVSLLPIIEADYYGCNEHANYPPPTPWCALTLQAQKDDQQAATGAATAAAATAAATAAPSNTICYLDANWIRSDQEPHTRQQLCTLNTAPYLFEASFFEKRMAQEWSIGDLVEATLLQRSALAGQGEESAAALAEPEPALQLGEVRRIGRIIDIKAQPPTALKGANLDHSPYRCLHVLWLTPMQDSADTFVIDLWNQDIRTVSPWEIQPAPADIRLASCLPPLQIKPKMGSSSELNRAITSTLNKLYELVWRVLWLPPTENSSQRYFSALLGTPTRCLEHVRNQFLQVVERHSLRLYTEWSLFESDLRELIHLLHSSLHAHLDSHDGDDVSALIPPLVRCADEALLPLPPHEANAYVDAAATMQRVVAEERLASQWRQQCPAAAGQVMAAIILIIETTLLSNPTWIDSFGQLHISPAPSGVAVAPQASRLKLPSYQKLSQLLQGNK